MPHVDRHEARIFADMDDTLGGRMAHARDSAGLSLEKVARAMNLHAATINYWEADRAAPSRDAVEALAQVLHVSPLWLTTGFGSGPDEQAADPLAAGFRSRDRQKDRTPTPPASRLKS